VAKNEKAPKDSDKDAEVDAETETDAADTDALDSDDALDSEEVVERTSDADSFWEKVGVEPIEIAMPKGVGLTLRAYRMSDTVESDEEETESDDEAEVEEVEEEKPKSKRDKKPSKKDDDEEEDSEDAESDEDSDDEDKDSSDDEEDEDGKKKDKDSDEEEADEPEEIPIFLSQDGALPLFETPEALVAFVKSDAATELRAIDTWDELVKGIKAEYVVPTDDDSYELDLVVKNLRGGHDTWDPELMIGAGELARDLGFALKLPAVMSTLAVGSPLDDLDNALRSVVDGGLKAMFAKRRVRKVGTQQTTLAWRGIITKIAETVDWRN
jgi:hypothetical protein